ncbi:hypothetical protein HZS_4586 [Henneguya salminicola]|nr:hypothetical protein HZS_4586 [Henneguya salminicola]
MNSENFDDIYNKENEVLLVSYYKSEILNPDDALKLRSKHIFIKRKIQNMINAGISVHEISISFGISQMSVRVHKKRLEQYDQIVKCKVNKTSNTQLLNCIVEIVQKKINNSCKN